MTKEYKIGGISVEFPYKAYGPQLAYMSKVVATLEKSRLRPEGKCNALLESPTGSGKSLALLCATLAWQQHYKGILSSKPTSSTEPGSKVDRSDPLIAGGGFIVEDTPKGLESEIATRQKEAPPKVPRIFYATRTHAQITQVIREFRKTKYRVRMAILGAKRHYCTNKQVLKKKNVDEDCLELLRGPPQLPGCRHFQNAAKVKSHPSILPGGSNDVHDIEDLVKIGHSVKGCAYFAARTMAMEAEIVFCPYSYVIDPIIRDAVEADIRGSIIIFDEAHNIEDVAREAGSVDLETSALFQLRSELQELCTSEPNQNYYEPLFEMVQDLLGWTEYQSNHLKKSENERYSSCWTGDEALQELRAAGIPLESFEVLRSFSRKAVSAASDEEVNHLSGTSAKALERLFRVLQFMLQNSATRAVDYQLVVQKFLRRDKDISGPAWIVSVSLWCLNPAVVFEEISTLSRSIIVTSGTLAPIESFASELGVLFDVRIEAPHVVDMETQVWAAALSVGPRDVVLNASYKNTENSVFQDAVGASLLEIFKVTPDGVLVFLPSYKLLTKLCDRWQLTGLWRALSNHKSLFIEPRVNDEKFESVLQGYYRAIRGDLPNTTHASKTTKKRRDAPMHESVEKIQTNGAAFFAVCRGKVSEGIDFSDKNARAVVLVGIPFPNVKDIQVRLKKQYNSTYQKAKKLLHGDQWYCQQAFRALNQAVGRCIRHRFDYGSIILLDERFKATKNLEYMSKWLRKSIRHFDNFQASMGQLQDFFIRIKEIDLGPSSRSPEDVGDKLHEVPLLGQKNAAKPITPVPITPLKSESGMLRVSNTLELCTTSETLKNLNFEGNVSSSPLLRSGLLPNFESTELRPTPSFCLGDICAQQEASGTCGIDSGPQFLTQPYLLSGSPVCSPNEDLCKDAPGPVSGIRSSAVEERKNTPDPLLHIGGIDQIDPEDINYSVSITDIDGPLYSSMRIEHHDEEMPFSSVGANCQRGSTANFGNSGLKAWRSRTDRSKVQTLEIGDHIPEQRPNLFSCSTDQPFLERSGRHEAACAVLQGGSSVVSSAAGCPTICCRRCGLNLGTMSTSNIMTLQKSYLTTLQDSNRRESSRFSTTISVYITDISFIGSGLTEGREPRQEDSSVQIENYKRKQSGVWVEEDGCVFKPLVCTSCIDFYVGVHIIAADSNNLVFINKVAIFAESVRADQEKNASSGCHKSLNRQEIVNQRTLPSPSKRASKQSRTEVMYARVTE